MEILIQFDMPQISKIHFESALPDESIESLMPELKRFSISNDCIFKIKKQKNETIKPETPFRKLSDGRSKLTITVFFPNQIETLDNKINSFHSISSLSDLRQKGNNVIDTNEKISFIKDIFSPKNVPFPLDFSSPTDSSIPKHNHDTTNSTGINTHVSRHSSHFHQRSISAQIYNPQKKKSSDPSNFSDLISQITEIGFSRSEAESALRKNNFDITSATNYLLQNKETKPTESNHKNGILSAETISQAYDALSDQDKQIVDRLEAKGYQLSLILQCLEACNHDEELTEQILASN